MEVFLINWKSWLQKCFKQNLNAIGQQMWISSGKAGRTEGRENLRKICYAIFCEFWIYIKKLTFNLELRDTLKKNVCTRANNPNLKINKDLQVDTITGSPNIGLSVTDIAQRSHLLFFMSEVLKDLLNHTDTMFLVLFSDRPELFLHMCLTSQTENLQ